MATARCVLPRPGLPWRIRQRPSVTKSGASAEPSSARRSVDWKVKSKSSMVLRKGKLGAARQPAEAGLLTVSDLLGDEQGEEVVVGPLLVLGPYDQIAPDAPSVGQVQALEQAVEVDSRWGS